MGVLVACVAVCVTQAFLLDSTSPTYTFHSEKVSYSEAQARCRAQGQTLAMPETAQQWQALVSAKSGFYSNNNIWIGMDNYQGTWKWNDGQSVGYSHWMPGQPDNYHGVEHCVSWYNINPPASYATPDTWNDEQCDKQLPYVCQGGGSQGTNNPPASSSGPLKYTFHSEAVSYSDAQQRCSAAGHRLAMPETEQQWQALVAAKTITANGIWLGMDVSRWSKWMPGQPDNYHGNDHCGSWYTQNPPASWATVNTWDDEKCDKLLPYVCQDGASPTAAPGGSPGSSHPSGNVIWREDFNTFDHSKWQTHVTMSNSNGEFQMYTNDHNNVYVRNGMLYLKPTFTSDKFPGQVPNGYVDMHKSFGACTISSDYGCSRHGNIPPVMSGKVTSYPTLKFGTMEIRARLPKGDWLWPAIWLMPKSSHYGGWPRSGEIDVMESIGNEGNGGVKHISSTLHWGPSPSQNKYYKTAKGKTAGFDWSDDFYIWRLEWTDHNLKTFVDNQPILSVDPGSNFWRFGGFGGNSIWGHNKMAPFDQEFYLILNVAVGGTNGFISDNLRCCHGAAKPWHNSWGRNGGMKAFWEKRNDWQSCWRGDDTAMIIDWVEFRK